MEKSGSVDYRLDELPLELKERRLDFLWLELTRRCNLRCVHCYADSSPNPDGSDVLLEGHYFEVIESAASLGCHKIQFIGGEPTMVQQLPEYIAHARNKRFDFIEVFTNATEISDRLLTCFVDNQVAIATSFYSYQSEVHDAITKTAGSHRLTVSTLRRLVGAALSVRAGIIVMRQNSNDITDTVDFLRSIGVRNVGTDRLRPFGRGSSLTGQSGNSERKTITELCGSCWQGTACIFPDGGFAPCIMAKSWSIGSILSKTLYELVQSQALLELRKQIYQEVWLPRLQYGPGANGFSRGGQFACDPRCNPNCIPLCVPSCSPSCSPCYPSGKCNPELFCGPCGPTKRQSSRSSKVMRKSNHVKTSDKAYLLEITLLRDKVPSFEEYPFSLPVVRNLETLAFHPNVTFLVGENGTGKSTLMEAIAQKLRFNPEGGNKNTLFSTKETHSNLHEYLKASRSSKIPKDGYFLRAESFYNVASYMDEIGYLGSYGGKSLHQQSHGESFLSLLNHKFRGNGLYLLDEPEAALSPARQLSALAIMHKLVKANSQLIIATHSPIIIAYPSAWIYHLTETGIQRVEYTETEHYTVAKDFLNRHEKMMAILLEDPA